MATALGIASFVLKLPKKAQILNFALDLEWQQKTWPRMTKVRMLKSFRHCGGDHSSRGPDSYAARWQNNFPSHVITVLIIILVIITHQEGQSQTHMLRGGPWQALLVMIFFFRFVHFIEAHVAWGDERLRTTSGCPNAQVSFSQIRDKGRGFKALVTKFDWKSNWKKPKTSARSWRPTP